MKSIATLIASLALVLPSTALAAGSSTCQSYSPQTCQVPTTSTAAQATENAATTTTTPTATSSTLPFTGLDVVLLAAGGGSLLGAGLLVRRLSRGIDD
jgi:hypothetical protein